MRVTCPNCSAVYEAPDSALGVGGRRVECSACRHQWFQPGPELEAMETAPSTMPGMSQAARELSALSETSSAPAHGLADEPEAPPAAASRLRTGEPPRPPRPGAPRPGETRAPGARRPASIDAERLSAELRAAEAEEERGAGAGMGYAAGFVLALILCGALAFAYVEKDQVAAMLPEASPYLDAWAGFVDQARLRIEAVAALIAQKVGELLG
ncbi:zinc-ribbon domain-containing protein [Albimonas pacifica]|uniref:MJ0042 family finger-like domain-containing protein n=1 Tax=Albimonas pacifica TaxID=1114924 RepID=A0A1I3DZ81_9RHOB|nr:zinc-ribbon domain-containing protein [Albimonas pacifica]SFH91751.1 MJ0042 family finger-like domain-containing protein [Albimonas pacifica]